MIRLPSNWQNDKRALMTMTIDATSPHRSPGIINGYNDAGDGDASACGSDFGFYGVDDGGGDDGGDGDGGDGEGGGDDGGGDGGGDDGGGDGGGDANDVRDDEEKEEEEECEKRRLLIRWW